MNNFFHGGERVNYKLAAKWFPCMPSCHADERLGDPPPKVHPGTFSGQRQGWKTPRGSPGGGLILCV